MTYMDDRVMQAAKKYLVNRYGFEIKDVIKKNEFVNIVALDEDDSFHAIRVTYNFTGLEKNNPEDFRSVAEQEYLNWMITKYKEGCDFVSSQVIFDCLDMVVFNDNQAFLRFHSDVLCQRVRRKIIKKKIALCFCLSLFLFPQLAFADDYAAKQAEAEAEAALQSLNILMGNFEQKSLEYDAAVLEQEEAEKKVEEAQETIKEKTGEIEKFQGKLSSRMEEMYRNGELNFVDVLLNSATFEEFSSNVFLLDRINANDSQLIEQTKTAKEELEKAKTEYEEQSDRAAKAAQEALEAKEDLSSQISNMQAVYDGLSAEAQTLLASKSEAASLENGNSNYSGGSGDGGSVTVPQSEISSYDETTGSITLSDGTQGTLVGYDSNGNAIVERAYAALGSAYVWGGVGGASGGYDCSGLVSYALTGRNERLGTTGTFMGWSQVTDPQPGDVCTSEGHCGIYIGNGQMIHAADYGTGVVIGKVQEGMKFVTPN